MTIRDAKEILGHIRGIANAPVINMILLFGFLLIICSFIQLNGWTSVSFAGSPKLAMLIPGIVLIIAGPVIFVLTREDRRINKNATIQKGFSLDFDQLSVNLKVGEIQNIAQLSKDSAVVLPANTSFVDDCITDQHSALGAFFLKHHPDKIAKAPQDFQNELQQSGYQQSQDGTYALGATIVLPQEYDTPAKTVITACTVRKEVSGIRAEPSSICECIRHVFVVTADKKISKLYMPILGSGHGGLDLNAALLFILLSIRHYASYYHHVKSIDIIVTENDATRLNELYRVQYLMFLGGKGR